MVVFDVGDWFNSFAQCYPVFGVAPCKLRVGRLQVGHTVAITARNEDESFSALWYSKVGGVIQIERRSVSSILQLRENKLKCTAWLLFYFERNLIVPLIVWPME